jgi:hypothetical protein
VSRLNEINRSLKAITQAEYDDCLITLVNETRSAFSNKVFEFVINSVQQLNNHELSHTKNYLRYIKSAVGLKDPGCPKMIMDSEVIAFANTEILARFSELFFGTFRNKVHAELEKISFHKINDYDTNQIKSVKIIAKTMNYIYTLANKYKALKNQAFISEGFYSVCLKLASKYPEEFSDGNNPLPISGLTKDKELSCKLPPKITTIIPYNYNNGETKNEKDKCCALLKSINNSKGTSQKKVKEKNSSYTQKIKICVLSISATIAIFLAFWYKLKNKYFWHSVTL